RFVALHERVAPGGAGVGIPHREDTDAIDPQLLQVIEIGGYSADVWIVSIAGSKSANAVEIRYEYQESRLAVELEMIIDHRQSVPPAIAGDYALRDVRGTVRGSARCNGHHRQRNQSTPPAHLLSIHQARGSRFVAASLRRLLITKMDGRGLPTGAVVASVGVIATDRQSRREREALAQRTQERHLG